MPGQAIIVVGASAGGVEALLTLAGVLPPDLPAAVLVVLHTSAHPSALPRLLSRRGPLPAFFFLARSFQPMALAPSWMAWGRPQERMTCL